MLILPGTCILCRIQTLVTHQYLETFMVFSHSLTPIINTDFNNGDSDIIQKCLYCTETNTTGDLIGYCTHLISVYPSLYVGLGQCERECKLDADWLVRYTYLPAWMPSQEDVSLIRIRSFFIPASSYRRISSRALAIMASLSNDSLKNWIILWLSQMNNGLGVILCQCGMSTFSF